MCLRSSHICELDFGASHIDFGVESNMGTSCCEKISAHGKRSFLLVKSWQSGEVVTLAEWAVDLLSPVGPISKFNQMQVAHV